MARTQARRSPRIIFVSDADPRAREVRSGSARVGWRVIAANNRPLGRSATVFASERDCHAAVQQLQSRVEEVSASVLFDSTRGHWTWGLLLDGAPVAICVHPYLRRIECTRALAQFIDAIRVGEPELARVRNLGLRALPGYDGPPDLAATGSPLLDGGRRA